MSKKKKAIQRKKHEFFPREGFDLMSDSEIVLYFSNNEALTSRFIDRKKWTRTDSINLLNKVMFNCDQKDFAYNIKLYSKAFKTESETKLRFVDYVISYISFLSKEIDYQSKREDLVKDPISYTRILLPDITEYSGDKYYYDFAVDFFRGEEAKYLKDKYKMNHHTYVRALRYINKEGLVPTFL
jgi:hypothetical protein